MRPCLWYSPSTDSSPSRSRSDASRSHSCGEAAGLGQLVAGAGVGEQLHAAAGADRGELAVVADQQQLRAGRLDVPVDCGEVGGVGHRGLVDHDQVARRAAATPASLGRVRSRRRAVAWAPASG